MDNDKIIEKIYSLTSESRLADTRLEIHFKEMDKRIEAIEKLSTTMAENLNDMKHLQTIVDSLSCLVHQNSDDIKTLKTKCLELEQRPLKEKASKWQYILDTFFKTVIGVICGLILANIGLGGNK